jgi:phage protein D
MANKTYQIIFDGSAASDDFYGDVVSLTVEESTAAAGTFYLQLAARLQDDGSWTYLDDDRLTLFAKVTIKIGFTGGGDSSGVSGAIPGGSSGDQGLTTVFNGYITDVQFSLGSNPGDTFLNVSGMDSTVLMGSEEKISTWPNMKDSEIVSQILDNYGLKSQVDATKTTHQDNVTTVIQRATDLEFVRELAQRNGMEFYVESDDKGNVTGFFRAPQLGGSAQPDLAIQAGDQSHLRSFAAHLNGQRPLNVKVVQMDVRANSPKKAQISDADRTKLGANDASGLVGGPLGGLVTPKDALAQMLVRGTPTSDATEMQTLAQAVRDDADWLIGASGEINGEAYQSVLRPRRLVQVKGAGKAYSGKYYVTRVSHEIKHDGSYNQRFEARRNARDLDGGEKFGSNGSGVSIPGI